MNTYLRAVFRFIPQKYKILPYFVLFFVSFHLFCSFLGEKTCSSTFFRHQALSYYNIIG